MRTVEEFAEIRRLRRDGLTIRQIAEQLNHSPKTILKVLAHSEPVPYSRKEPYSAPVFGPFRAIVEAILTADETAPRKQRHTAAQIHRRLLREHAYTGGYDQIRRFLHQKRLDRRETFIPLDHRPGVRAEADFGHIAVDFPDGRRPVPVLIVTWSYSNAPFAIALPTERTEAILHGLVEAFAYFEAVPQELWWDNPTTVAIHVLRGRERTLHTRYAALASHYLFTPKFCMPAKGNEKPRVENRVYDLERQWATPVPRVVDLEELNGHLRDCCRAARNRTCGANADTVGARFEQDRVAALSLPNHPFDACVTLPGQVDKYQTVAFDDNRYSVPRRYAFRSVTIKGYVDRVAVIADNREIARHRRCYAQHEKVLDPLHFLVVLERKPAALDHAPVYRDWQLPAAFPALRLDLETRLGRATGSRQYIRVLQLLAEYSMNQVEEAIAICRALDKFDASAIRDAVERTVPNLATIPELSNRTASTIPLPNLSQFNGLLSHSFEGDYDDEQCRAFTLEGQSETTETADHLSRT